MLYNTQMLDNSLNFTSDQLDVLGMALHALEEGIIDPSNSQEVNPLSREESANINYPVFTRGQSLPHEDIQDSANNTEVIPSNSESLLISEETSRFSSAIWFNKIQEQDILLAGVGGIGSFVGFLLSRMHPRTIRLYDGDSVEIGNLSGQLYSTESINNRKVDALAEIMGLFSNYYNIYTYSERFTEDCTPYKIMICGFDNMSARRTFYESWKGLVGNLADEDKENCLYIDGRLAAEEFQVLCIQGNDTYHMNKYEHEWLFSDEEAEATQCSYKQTSFCANMIASVMVNLLVNFIANKCNPLIERAVPFFTYYDASQMFVKEEF